MPLYFAYGSNMDEAALRLRAPKARAVGPARLARHRFVIMGNGYASVARDASAEVHGVLFDIAMSDVAPLDRYEDIAHGLYTKTTQPVVRQGGSPCRALIYIGTARAVGGIAPAGYMEDIIAAGRAAGLPTSYLATLQSFLPNPMLRPADRGAR